MHPPHGLTGTGGSSGAANRSPPYRASPNRKPGIGVPHSNSRNALTSQRARATIASHLLNAREPLPLNDLQQWLGHQHPAGTRYYAAIL